jgi:hypothetical protein
MVPARGMTCELFHTGNIFSVRTSPLAIAAQIPAEADELAQAVVAPEQCRDLREERARREQDWFSFGQGRDHRITHGMKRSERPCHMPAIGDQERGRNIRPAQQFRRKRRVLVSVA